MYQAKTNKSLWWKLDLKKKKNDKSHSEMQFLTNPSPPGLRPGDPKCISTASPFPEEIPSLCVDGTPPEKKSATIG